MIDNTMQKNIVDDWIARVIKSVT